MICPVCGKNLGDGSEVDMGRDGWVCCHDGFDVKIYVERKIL